MVALIDLIAHRPHLPLHQRMKGRQQGIETRRRFQRVEHPHDSLDGRQCARQIGVAHPISGNAIGRQRQARQAGQIGIARHQSARLPPRTIGNHQQQRPALAHRPRLARRLARKQQPAAHAGPPPQRGIEALAHVQLGLAQPERGQAGGVERMARFRRMLQKQHAGTARERGYQRAQAMGSGPRAARAYGTGHGKRIAAKTSRLVGAVCHRTAGRDFFRPTCTTAKKCA
ncbi:Uncharacterised protein [Bordetella pertussis]|nr:Uncharacterised protein [Bordetella pertussis]